MCGRLRAIRGGPTYGRWARKPDFKEPVPQCLGTDSIVDPSRVGSGARNLLREIVLCTGPAVSLLLDVRSEHGLWWILLLVGIGRD